MRWITAAQLENWAKSVSARADLPKVVSDLLRASSPDLISIRFPSGDKGQVRGFDGHLESDLSALNVPRGRSYWEFGSGSEAKAKIKDDFSKRTIALSEDERKDITFVFVTPRTWDDPTAKIEDFVADLRAGSGWRDVRYIDGSALETWLEQHPAVSAWHARNTIRVIPADGIRSTDEYWEEFSGKFGPSLSEDVVLCERDSAVQQLISDLLLPSNSLQLLADSPEEVLAFTIAAIRKAAPEVRLYLEAKTLVVDSTAAGRNLPQGASLILLLRNDAAKSPRQFAPMGTTLVPLGRQPRGSSVTTLLRPTAYAMGVAIRSMGIEENRALTLARGCGRSLTALSRLIPGGHYDPPKWLEKGRSLLPAILAGGWDASNNSDKEIVEQITGGKSITELEAHARDFLRDEDPPLDMEGTIWKVRAPMDAFVRIGHLIGRQEAEWLVTALHTVFSEVEPEVDPNEPVAFSRASAGKHSEWLREGLATTLLLFAVWGGAAEVDLGGQSCQEFANRILNDLPGLRTDTRLLASLRRELPLLAEAAPGPLLSALEHMLEGNEDAFVSLFTEKHGWLHPTSNHTGLLWALEVIAWDPEYFHRAVMILARLAAVDPGGKLTNRPRNSLSEIFVLWNPNTNASSAERLTALDSIISGTPEIGWRLVLSLLPSFHSVSSPTAKPKLREAGASDRAPVTYKELWANQRAVAERAISCAGHDIGRWMELVGRLTAFPPTERETALNYLDRTLSMYEENKKKPLWAKLRDEAIKHERFQNAEWTLKDFELSQLQALAQKHAPKDSFLRTVSLFDRSVIDESPLSIEHLEKQVLALRQICFEKGPGAILELSREVERPYGLAEAVRRAGFAEHELLEILNAGLDANPISDFTTVMSSLYRSVAGSAEAEKWITELAQDGQATPNVIAEFLLRWPDGRPTWTLVRELGLDVTNAYWSQRPAFFIEGRRLDCLYVALRLLRHGRALQAIQSVYNRVSEIPSSLIIKMIDSAIVQINLGAKFEPGMIGFYFEQLFAALDVRSDVSAHDVAMREYKAFPLLEYGGRKLKLFEVLAAEPQFYHLLLRTVYRGTHESKANDAPNAESLARHSYSILSKFEGFPGAADGEVNRAEMDSWIDEVIKLGIESDRADITEAYVGRVIAHAPMGQDGLWPHSTVATLIERLSSPAIEHAIQIERFNMRGAFSKSLYEGGKQERDLAETARRWAVGAVSFPRTAALLRAIENMWEESARAADLRAAQDRLRS